MSMSRATILGMATQSIAVSFFSIIFTLKFVEYNGGSPLIPILLFGVPFLVAVIFNKRLVFKMAMMLWLTLLSIVSCGVIGVAVFGY
jgi:hypothetical protein